jgi:hypothetical protein
MASIIWSDVVAMAPELALVPGVSAQNDILAYVNVALDVSLFGGESGPKLRLARIYLAAHFGKLSSQGGVGIAGPVIAESAGGLSRSYANLTMLGAHHFGGTVYADMFNELVDTSMARLPIVMG